MCCCHYTIPIHEKKFENIGVVKFNWFMGIFDWLFVALAIYALISKEGFDLFIACIATHAFFMSEKFLTTFFIYFFKGYSKDNSPILKFIYSRPQIIITGTTSKEGTVQYAPDQDERRATIITDIKKNEFQYYSSRDISGKIDLSGSVKKSLIVEISYEYKFADDISNCIYGQDKIRVSRKLKGQNLEISEEIKPHNYPYESEKYLINKNPIFINRFVYIIFTLLSFARNL